MCRKEELEREIARIESLLPTLPEGNFICAGKNGQYKWYQNVNHTKIYISKKQRHIAEQLAYKKYLSAKLKELRSELLYTITYINNCSIPSVADNLLINSPEHRRLISPYFVPLNVELSNWISSSYDKNLSFPENLIHTSISGNKLRSKSESIIDMILFQKQIPYRYECQLLLGDRIIYPDFTIRHPKSGKFFYWEHFGQMDNPEYNTKVGPKLQLYISHNIIPTINLITTYETTKHPLTAEYVSQLIKQYFL